MAAGGAAIATADGEPGGLAALGFGTKSVAAPAAPAPLPPTVAEPAVGSDASRVIRTEPAAEQPAPPKPAPERLTIWSPLQAIGVVPPAKPQPPTAAAPRVAAAIPQSIGRVATNEPGGSFDPDVGTAAHVVSDGRLDTDSRPPRPQAWDGQPSGAPPQPLAGGLVQDGGPDEPERSVKVSDEPVSLVSWLAGQYSGLGAAAPGQDVFLQNPCMKDPCCKDPCCPTWEAQVDALFLWQGNIPSRVLYTDTVTQQPALDVNQLQNRAAIAPRYAIIYNRDECRSIEANYFQVYGFNAQQSVGPSFRLDPQTGNTVGAFQTNDLPVAFFDGISSAQATSSAHIQSLEVNLRQRDGGMITWITGFRWVEWGQNLGINDVQYQSVPDPLDPTAPPVVNTATDIYSVTTLNNLYGWQWGGDMMLWNAGRRLRINGIGKAGIYYNHQASQNTFYSDLNNPPVAVGASKDVVSFVGETGVNCSWAITNWLSWRAGYSFFWLSGVAVPANQLAITSIDVAAPQTSAAAVNATSSVLIHGATTGLEARW